MKYLLIVISAGTMFFSCSKLKNAEVIKNCTGTYVKVGSKTHRVCNFSQLNSFDDGEEIQIEFAKNPCQDPNESVAVCMMVYGYNGDVIEIKNVK